MASQAPDDVTPSPKQVVFLFMAATAVAVVVFLCGVLVGRGVPFVEPLLRTDGGGAATAGLFGDERRPAVINTPNSEPSAAATSGDDLTYFRRLESDVPVEEAFRNPRASVDPPPPVADLPEPSIESASAAEPAAPVSPGRGEVEQGSRTGGDPSLPGSQAATDPAPAVTARSVGWAVQVLALRERPAAQDVADDLSAKGFPAFVVDPVPDAPVDLFRIRVGPFADRADAERAQLRLETEEHLDPWITR